MIGIDSKGMGNAKRQKINQEKILKSIECTDSCDLNNNLKKTKIKHSQCRQMFVFLFSYVTIFFTVNVSQ